MDSNFWFYCSTSLSLLTNKFKGTFSLILNLFLIITTLSSSFDFKSAIFTVCFSIESLFVLFKLKHSITITSFFSYIFSIMFLFSFVHTLQFIWAWFIFSFLNRKIVTFFLEICNKNRNSILRIDMAKLFLGKLNDFVYLVDIPICSFAYKFNFIAKTLIKFPKRPIKSNKLFLHCSILSKSFSVLLREHQFVQHWSQDRILFTVQFQLLTHRWAFGLCMGALLWHR